MLDARTTISEDEWLLNVIHIEAFVVQTIQV